eukprot:gene5430-7521_t
MQGYSRISTSDNGFNGGATNRTSQSSMPRLTSTAKISLCAKSFFTINLFNLQVINFIDFSLGCVMLSFSVYLYLQFQGDVYNPNTSWIIWCSLILGALLLLVSVFSICAITSKSCRWGIVPSRYFCLILALMSLAMGSTSLALQKQFTEFIDTEGSSTYALSQHEINLIKDWYTVLSYGWFCMTVLQILRYALSQGFRENALRMDGEFDALVEEDNKHWNEKLAYTKVSAEEKYNDLRQYYKEKYKTRSSSSSQSSASQQA